MNPISDSSGGGHETPTEAPSDPVLVVRELSKTFVGQRALQRVSFDVRPGEVHALVGHNGSGKSTLIKILAGFHEPDASDKEARGGAGGGTVVEVAGEPLRMGDASASRSAGLRFIHQELGLVERLTVLENLRLGGTWRTALGGRIRWGAERRAARELLERVGLRIHPETIVEDLSAVQRTQVAVARALQDDEAARILFFDEPTATLPSSEVDRLFAVIEATVAQGISVVYVSHRLEELPRIADRVTVLRDGRVVGSGPLAEFARERLVEMIVGDSRRGGRATGTPAEVGSHPASAGATTEPAGATTAPAANTNELGMRDAPGEERLRFEGVSGGELRGADFTVHAGEIVGIAGLVGSGVGDVVGVLFGTVERQAGRILLDGDPLRRLDPHELVRRRVAVLPSARALKSVPTLTVRENLTLPYLAPLWRHGRLQLREERALARELVERYNVLPRDPERILATLSGGNQQKVTVAKWLRTEPRAIVLDEPTQGVDVGGKREILDLLRDAAREGVGILVCSSDLEELELVCDRVLVIRRGQIGAELTGPQITRERIAQECYSEEAAHV